MSLVMLTLTLAGLAAALLASLYALALAEGSRWETPVRWFAVAVAVVLVAVAVSAADIPVER